MGFPEKEERREILDIYFKNFDFKDVQPEDISERTANFTSSDLVALLKEVQIKKARTLLENRDKLKEIAANGGEIRLQIDKEHFDRVFDNFRPALNINDIKRYDKLYSDFRSRSVDVNKQKSTMY